MKRKPLRDTRAIPKALAIALAAAVCLLGAQTYRVHRLAQRIAAFASVSPDAAKDDGTPAPGTTAQGDIVYGDAARDLDLEDDGDEVNEHLKAMALHEQEDSDEDGEGEIADPQDGSQTAGQSGKAAGDGNASKSDSDRASDRKAWRAEQARLNKETHRLMKSAQEAVKQGDYQGAIDMLKQGLEANPGRRELYNGLAKLYRTLGMTEEELGVYADWASNRPNDATPHYLQASAYESLGMDKEALAQLTQFQQLSKGKPEAYPVAASLYRRLGMSAQEGALLQSWASEAPGSVDAHRSLAQYYARAGDRPAAIAQYESIEQITPMNASAHVDLASAYQQARRYGDAQTELVTAMNLQPQNMAPRLQLAQVYQQMGDRESALQTYANVIADAPASPEALQAQRAIDRIERQLAAAQRPKPPRTQPNKPN